METSTTNEKVCIFCESSKLQKVYAGRFNKFIATHGPFDFYQCQVCRSGLTIPLPSEEALTAFYKQYDGGMSKFTRDIRTRNSLTAWYTQCVDRAVKTYQRKKPLMADFTWVDIGAGNGEVARIMADHFPDSKGLAVDYHERPNLLDGYQNIEWKQCDLNQINFVELAGEKFDLVVSITVLEHVLDPENFLQNMVNLMNEDGAVYITCPDISSSAAKILGPLWPYLIFGEHLNIPSKKGMSQVLSRIAVDKLAKPNANIEVNPIVLPYTLTYYFDHFGLRFLSRLFSTTTTVKIKTGILEASIF